MSDQQDLVGAVLNGRWRLVRLLGEGGMGAVYEADGTRNEGKRAIKLLHQEFVKEELILQRFFTEARASQSLQHPNVAQVFDSGTAENGTPYLVMELLQGVPLSAYTDQQQAIPPQKAVPIVYGILQALALAHERHIVHRDLKPDNLFLVRDARGNFVVKVLDFGIAKVMDAAGGMGSKTRTGALLGTPGYMSPEQIRNSKGVDARSDLWSVGIIFYEMLTGAAPFPADNEFTRLTAVLVEDMKPIAEAAPQLAAWGPFFARALAKEPAQRFQSAEEMARALTAHAGGEPASIVPVSMPMSMVPAAAQPGAAPVNTPAPVATYLATPVPPQPASMPPPQAPPVPPPGRWPSAPMLPVPPTPGGPTHVSGLRPVGTPATSSLIPSIEVIQAPPFQRGAPWWLVGVVGFVCLGLGFVIGFLVG